MPLETTYLLPPSEPMTEEACFAAFIPLAARVTNLRTILQHPQVITKEEAFDWVADIDSTMNDFMLLLDHCRVHVKARIAPPVSIIEVSK